MASWTLYTIDRAQGLTQAISPLVSATHGAASAAEAVDSRQTTLWVPATTGVNIRWGVNLQASRSIAGFALGNIIGASGVSMQAYSGNELLTIDTARGANAAMPNGITDWVYIYTGAPISSQYWTLEFDNIPSGFAIGTISVLDDTGKIVFGSSQSPRFPVGRSGLGSNPVVPIAGGDELVRVVAGPRGTWQLRHTQMDATIDGQWQEILDSYFALNEWSAGVWLTLDDFADASLLARGFYCRPVGGIQGGIYGAGPVGEWVINLVEMGKGPR